ncbi:BCCT family transporter [Neptuniibacter halophilus]|uniref:BCCT family transporter n=1 Tax=Neptuniibacter halophilus TaxID=651666 RepID=UPI00257325C8|nr:BCCT family transporter [Neptuniibacter halophilus]
MSYSSKQQSRRKLADTTDYQIGQDNVQPFGLDIHNAVFPVSACCIIIFVTLTLIFQDQAAPFFQSLRPWLTTHLDWLFVSSMNLFLLFCLYLAFSPLGRIRIGGKKARPDYSYLSWMAMLLSCGIGIGLMFFGVLEPVNHSLQPPLGISPQSPDAASIGIAATLYHWGLHAWAVYAIIGLALAYFCYNHELPMTLRSAFFPLLGDRVWGTPGDLIDILAVFATIFGLATSLGYGAEQIAAGLQQLFALPESNLLKVGLILGITLIAIISVVAGMDAGIKRLSLINIALALLLLLLVLFNNSLPAVAERYLDALLDYGRYLIPLSNPFGREDTDYFHGWTTFYWAWWIAWSPFVGMFIARISRGRTIREFVISVLLIPTLCCLLWMVVFGGTALEQISTGYSDVEEIVLSQSPEQALFQMLEALPFSTWLSAMSLLLILTFFVTSSDSGSLVIDTITAGGIINPPVPQRVFWCSFEGLVAIALLLGGGLAALQAATVSSGLPFCLVILLICFSLHKSLSAELRR